MPSRYRDTVLATIGLPGDTLATEGGSVLTTEAGVSLALEDTPGLVGYWRLGETFALAADSGPNGLTGAFDNVGSITRGATGALSPADLDRAVIIPQGTQGFHVPDAAVMHLGSAFSIELFIYRVAGLPTATVSDIVGRSTTTGTDSNFSVVLLGADAGALDKRIGLWANLATGGAWTNLAISAGALPANQWMHVVFTYDAAGGGRVYFNGSQAGPTIAYAGAVTTAAGDLRLVGAGSIIDEVALYNRALTPPEVTNHFEARAGLAVPTLIVEAAFGQDAFTPAPVWTNITPYVLGYSTRRGRQRSLNHFEPGRLSLDLWAADGRFDPTYTAGPYGAGFSSEDVPVRISATWDGVTYGRFYGYVSRVSMEWPNIFDAIAHVDAEDALRPLAGLTAVIDELGDDVHRHWSGVRAWYRFDDGEGTWTAADSGPFARHGAYEFRAKLSTDPAVPSYARGSAMRNMYFEGQSYTTPQLGGALLPSTASPSGPGDWAVECMFRAREDGGVIISSHTYDGTQWEIAVLSTAVAGYPKGCLIVSIQGRSYYIGPTFGQPVVNDNKWHHVVMIRRASGPGTDWRLQAYVDGVFLVDEANASITSTTASSMTVGYTDLSAGFYEVQQFRGDVDELVIWNRAPGLGEIAFRSARRSYGWENQNTNERANRVLDAVGHPASLRAIGSTWTADELVLPVLKPLGTALAHLQAVEVTERGRLFVDRFGVLTFQGNPPDLLPTPTAILGEGAGEVHYSAPPAYSYDRDDTYTEVEVTADGQTPQTYATPGLSATRIARRLTVDTLLSDPGARSGRAFQLWSHNNTPRLRLPTLALDGWSDPLVNFPFILGLELTRTLTFRRRRPGIATVLSVSTIVNQMTEEVTPGRWSVTLGLEPADTA